jgi:prepilin-type N-terminal cleavage/methylation domain-containing protein
MKKAFTITELLVAVALLAVVLTACGVIFNYSIDSQRTAGATAEIMRNLRVITDQLNADFVGFMGAPAFIGVSPGDPNIITADSIAFLSTGDFQTSSGSAVRGNVARIYYGQSGSIKGVPDPLSLNDGDRRNKILARRQVIIAPDANVLNAGDEYEVISLAKILSNYEANNVCYKDAWLERPTIDITGDPNSIRMYLVRGVDNLKIEYLAGISAGKLDWRRPAGDFSGQALRFTFTLYDSKGIIKTGRRFEHIVYIGR